MNPRQADSEPLEPAVRALADDLRAGNRRALAKAITLIENWLPEPRQRANRLVSHLLPHTGGAVRVGISGVPGVGKSTLIEMLGMHLADRGKMVAVLAIDPSSTVSGGSILGDKVRMERLGRHPRAFIRPSPTAGTLGGVARRTREAMLLCEAAGFDVVLVETVGVGQSEVAVAGMVDCFALLLLPNAGDEIQGLKKGIVEMADAVFINKADGAFVEAAQQSLRHLSNAMHFFRPKWPGWQVPVETVSSLNGEDMARVWSVIVKHRDFLRGKGHLTALRREQARTWFHETIRDQLLDVFNRDPRVSERMPGLVAEIDAGRISPHHAAEKLIAAFTGNPVPPPGEATGDGG